MNDSDYLMDDSIDNFLEEIGANEKKEVAVRNEVDDETLVNFGKKQISIDDDDAIMAAVFTTALSDKEKADELYRTMETRLNFEKDRSPEAKTVLSDAVAHRISATNNLIKLLELRNKQKMKMAQGNSLVSLNLTPRETGININKLADEVLNS